ncbi:MAG: hypothetical protein CL878_07860 [Dehalococcoidia bacterium]|nr:hypothetical protein [Dehalococcoidia bacterium]
MRTIFRHLWWFRDGQYRRWRLETFGIYAPSLPHERPWWQVNPAALLALVRQFPFYLGWVRGMHILRRGGPEALWSDRLRSGDLARWRAWQLKQQVEE